LKNEPAKKKTKEDAKKPKKDEKKVEAKKESKKKDEKKDAKKVEKKPETRPPQDDAETEEEDMLPKKSAAVAVKKVTEQKPESMKSLPATEFIEKVTKIVVANKPWTSEALPQTLGKMIVDICLEKKVNFTVKVSGADVIVSVIKA
jgi:hypothetical protein